MRHVLCMSDKRSSRGRGGVRILRYNIIFAGFRLMRNSDHYLVMQLCLSTENMTEYTVNIPSYCSSEQYH